MLWFRFARKYMFSPKSHSVINIIASVSVIAVAVPTAAMIILVAMFEGLTTTINGLYSAIDGDIEIIAQRGQTFDDDALSLDALSAIEGVEAVAPYLEQSVIAASAGRRTTIALRGIDSRYGDVLPIEEYVASGTLSSLDRGEILLGSVVAAEIGTYGLGTEIELYALNRKQISTLLPTNGISRKTTHLGGIVATNGEIDATHALIDLKAAQQLLNYPNRWSCVAIRCSAGADIETIQRTLQHVVGNDFKVRTRDQKNASMNEILRMERFAILLIGLFITLVAAFSIVGSVVMLIADKRRDMQTLRAMGADSRLIRRIFVGEGALLTVVGALIGTLLGVGLALGQQQFGWVKIPGSTILDSYPVALNIGDVILIVLSVIAIGWLVARITVGTTLRHKQNND